MRGKGAEIKDVALASAGAAQATDLAALGGDDPCDRVGDDFGAGLALDGQPHRHGLLSGEGVTVPVPQTLGEDLPYEGCGGGAVEADVEEPGPGDLDAPDTGGDADPLAQDLGDVPGGAQAGRASCNAMFVA